MIDKVLGIISYIVDSSIAEKAGLRVGDQLVSINAQPVRDMLDFQYLTAEEKIDIVVLRNGLDLCFSITKNEEDSLGIEFDEELFGGVRKCQNNCIFCFLQQMPKGLRDTLYVKDDDYRLSLAQGNYITLTNLTDDDIERICSQRMSPLYISVHTTDPELREKMMRNKNAGRIMDTLRRFAESRITMQTQIVFCPGWNDRENLEKTVRDLASLHPRVGSIAIVPVGLTKYREGLTSINSVDEAVAREIISSCVNWQSEFLDKFGTHLVFPSDEFYIRAGVDFPSEDAYEGFPQLEDGIGVSRLFFDELDEITEHRLIEKVLPGKYVLVTGTLAQKQIQALANAFDSQEGIEARVCSIRNDFLGESVTVAGLLAGCDVIEALSDADADETVLIPDVCLNESRFLDDITINDIKQRICARVMAVPASPIAMIDLVSGDS